MKVVIASTAKQSRGQGKDFSCYPWIATACRLAMTYVQDMIRILLFLVILFQVTPSRASGPLGLPEPSQVESTPKSKDIKKIAKQLEDPEERQKLLKTLKVLAAAQEVEEKKQPRSLWSYMAPFVEYGIKSVHWIMGGLSASFEYIEKIPEVVSGYIDYFKVAENRVDFWIALSWLPILLIIEILFERLHLWLFRRAFEIRKPTEETLKLTNSKGYYAFFKLFFPSLYPVLFLPLYVSNASARNWVVGFWALLFASRLFVIEKRMLPVFAVGVKAKHSLITNIARYFVSTILGVILISGLGLCVGKTQTGQDFFLTPLILMSVLFLNVYLREWRVKEMPGYLKESRTFITAPHELGSLINLCIRYLPGFMIFFTVPLIIDWVFLEGSLWKTYGTESFITLLMLSLFLWGRRCIEALSHYKMPKFQSAKVQAFASYLTSINLTLARSLQWTWYLSFLITLLAIWNHYFSGSLINVFSHPLTKSGANIAFIWGIIYLFWLGLDWFVQFHTKPQNIKGKRREPTIFAKTFGPMLHSVACWVLVLVAIFLTLESLGFDLKILVYLMSAFAFAISLGSQSLVKDIINGFFALIDGSFALGDVITVGSHTGAVESLSLRSLTLRHSDGALQTIPFSEVGNIINKSRDYAVVSFDVAVSYRTEIGKVYEALNKALEEMMQDPTFGKMILTPLSITGVDRFAESAVHVSASIRITPDPYRYFAREFNRRLKVHMDALKIAPPITFHEKWSREK